MKNHIELLLATPSMCQPRDLLVHVSYCKERILPIVLGCVASSHHIVYHRVVRTSTRVGNDVLDYLLTIDLQVVILKTENTATFHNSVREEVIDITLCSEGFKIR